MSIAYRELRVDDYDAICTLWRVSEGVSFSDSDTRHQIDGYLRRNPGCSFVATDGDRIIGTILAGEDGRRGFINHLYVDPDYRACGIGDRLVSLAEHALADRNPTKSYVFVENSNHQAIRFWKKHHYALCDDFCTMRKALTDEPYAVYEELTVSSVLDYVNHRGLLDRYGCQPDRSALSAVEIGDGNMSHIFKVTNGERSIIVKQAMPHGKIDDTVFEPTDRAVYEGEYVTFYAQRMTGRMPAHLSCDRAMCLNVYEDLTGLLTLRQRLLDGVADPQTGESIGRYIADEMLVSSTISLSPAKKTEMEGTFANTRMRELTENYVLLSPFFGAANNNVDPITAPLIADLAADKAITSRAVIAAGNFVSNKQCLIHGDLHPGNVFVGPDGCIVFDAEFATWGPVSYDLGTIVGNLMLSLAVAPVVHPNQPDLPGQIIDMIEGVYFGFCDRLVDGMSNSYDPATAKEYAVSLANESLPYAAANIGGRTYGYARFPEIARLDSHPMRVFVVTRLVDHMRFLMLECRSAGELVASLRSQYQQ